MAALSDGDLAFLEDWQPDAPKRAAPNSNSNGSPAAAVTPPLAKRSAVLVEPPEEAAGFIRSLFTLLRVCAPDVVGWSSAGDELCVRDPRRFAAEICPKFFRHSNFNSFTRLLNMFFGGAEFPSSRRRFFAATRSRGGRPVEGET